MVPLLAIAGLVVIAYLVLEAMPTSSNSSETRQISLAIGVAEGGYDASGNNLGNGTAPSQNHNPGDLSVDVNGTGTGVAMGFVVYATDEAGYTALDYQVNEWLNGTSANAGPDSTIDQISTFYTTDVPPGAQAAWAANVAATLGVPSSTPISQIANPQAAAVAATQQVSAPAAPSDDTTAELITTGDDTSDSSSDGEGDDTA